MRRIPHRLVDSVELKRCYVCDEWKVLEEFHRDLSRWDGLFGSCKGCHAGYVSRHTDEIRERQRQWHQANRERRLKQLRTHNRIYYAEHREESRDRVQRWSRANPAKICAQTARRKARKLNANGADYTTAELIEARKEVGGGVCYLCGNSSDAIDHVIPLAKGGTHWPANQRPVCTHCNSRKTDKWPYDIEKHRIEHGYYERVRGNLFMETSGVLEWNHPEVTGEIGS